VDVSHAENFLQHHGVKGMKWGVRKERVDGKDGDFVVSKDNPIYNISANAPRNASGAVYAAFTKNDVINYRSMYVAQLEGFLKAPKVFSNAFELKGNLNVAGEKAQVEAFQKLWKSNKTGIAKALAESQVDISFVAGLINRGLKIDRTKAYQKKFLDASEEYMMNKGYKQFQAALALPATDKFKTPYYSLLAKRGYSALLDLNDVKAFGGEKPILIFKGKDHLKNRDTVELTKTDIQLAMDTYFDPKKLNKYNIRDLHAKHDAFPGEEVENMSYVEDFLQHFGVKGMKWGQHRKSKLPASSDAQKSLDIRAKAKTNKAKSLTNAELQLAINRMNLEQQFKRLAVNERPPVQRWITSTLLEIGKREVQVAIGKKVATTIAKKVATGGAA
jgi:hypothetical protein